MSRSERARPPEKALVSMTVANIITAAWIVLMLYWIVSARNLKRTARAESLLTRLAHSLSMVAAYVLLFTDDLPIGPLNSRIVPRNQALTMTGAILTWAGVAGAIWARAHIGQYWSARVTLKEDHQLIDTGPYAYMRHPIYSGLLLATVGTAMARDEWRGVVSLAIVLVALTFKARKEEKLLEGQFGQDYRRYRLSTGFLIPRFRSL